MFVTYLSAKPEAPEPRPPLPRPGYRLSSNVQGSIEIRMSPLIVMHRIIVLIMAWGQCPVEETCLARPAPMLPHPDGGSGASGVI